MIYNINTYINGKQYMNNNTITQNNNIRNELLKWLQCVPFNFAFTFNFNRPTSFAAAKKDLEAWQRNVDRKVLGRNWKTAPTEQRLFCIGFPEHPSSNLHYHALISAPENPLKVQRVATKMWKFVVPSGDLWVSPLEAESDIRRVAGYATKELWNGVGIENLYISDE